MNIEEFERKLDADELMFIKGETVVVPIRRWYMDKETGEILHVEFYGGRIPNVSFIHTVHFDHLDDDMRKAIEEWEEKLYDNKNT